MRLLGKQVRTLALCLAVGLPAVSSAMAQDEKPLRFVLNTSLQVLDPITTTAFATRTFGYMVWDTLVGMDSKGEMRPQMLESWEVSEDGLTYSFKLRPGLKWTDGTPVTSADCIASLKRWGSVDGLGSQLIAATQEFRVVDDSTFELQLSGPFGSVIDALGKSAMRVPFMMPARIAEAPTDAPITEIVGSGPYIFDREAWRPGDRVVFHRNPDYVPRDEPADGFAGGKTAYIERVEFVSIPDLSTKVNALMAGDVDLLERAPADFLELLQADPSVTLTSARGGGNEVIGAMAMNHLQPPFDNVKVRQAAQLALRQPEMISALGYPDNVVYEQCLALFMCDSFYETEAGSEGFAEPNIERAKELLKEGGYNGEPVAYLLASDSAPINPLGLVAMEQLKAIGMNIVPRITDWATISQLRNERGPVGDGGWSMIPLIWTGFDMANPMTNPAVLYNCTEGFPGWWCDERQVPVLKEFAEEIDSGKRKEIATELQRLAYDNVNVVGLGQFSSPGVYRSDLEGVLEVGVPIAWNIRRKAE
jgi:peptide/nickel transport system substrate-binding protein